jgi:hypothetical protein
MKYYIKYYFCCLITLSFLFVGWGIAEAGVAPLICDAGGPYEAECQGEETSIQLDGSLSSGDEITFEWFSDCPNASFDGTSTSENPTLTVDTSSLGCPTECTVTLTVTDDTGLQSECTSDVTIDDTTEPDITACPRNRTITCTESTNPSNTGQATATDICDPTLDISFSDVETGRCPPEKTITRTWTAQDSCGNESECTQTITVVPVSIAIDIKPQSCPNPLNVKSQGLLPVAILGTVDLDVEDIDIATLAISVVTPVKSAFEDVATPTGFEPCDCLALSGDGTDDLVLKFKIQEIVDILPPAVQNGDLIPLTITGELLDGTVFEGIDCILIKGVK